MQGEEKRSVAEKRDEDEEEKDMANARPAALFAMVE